MSLFSECGGELEPPSNKLQPIRVPVVQSRAKMVDGVMGSPDKLQVACATLGLPGSYPPALGKSGRAGDGKTPGDGFWDAPRGGIAGQSVGGLALGAVSTDDPLLLKYPAGFFVVWTSERTGNSVATIPLSVESIGCDGHIVEADITHGM